MFDSIFGMTSRGLKDDYYKVILSKWMQTKSQLITIHMTHFLAMFQRSATHLCRVGKCMYTFFARYLFKEIVDYDCVCLFDYVQYS